MKILCIGNSFSQDASAKMQKLAPELFVRNLYIGGCSLERHVDCMKNDLPDYEYQSNGEDSLGHKVTLDFGLSAEKWDVITFQQVSGLSGIAESYEPYFTELLDYVRKKSDAKFYFHRTWGYEWGSDHCSFPQYGSDPELMYRRIVEASDAVLAKHPMPILDSGKLIDTLRKYPTFDVRVGGVSLHRDTFHMSEYGRYATAALWVREFTGRIPTLPEGEEFRLIEKVLGEM